MSMPAIRSAPSNDLAKDVDNNLLPENAEIFALIVPINTYNGAPVVHEVYRWASTRPVETVIIVAPSRSGSSERISITKADYLNTPTGEITVNDLIREELCDEDDDIFEEDQGIYDAVGIPAQIPYLRQSFDNFDVVPIVLSSGDLDLCRELGTALGEIIYGRRVLLVATVDIRSASSEDMNALRSALETLDVEQLVNTTNKENLDINGKGALLAVILAAKHRGADRMRLLHLSGPSDFEPGMIGGTITRG